MTAAAGGQKKPQTTGSKRGQNAFKVDGEDSAEPNGQRQSVTARWTGPESQERRIEITDKLLLFFIIREISPRMRLFFKKKKHIASHIWCTVELTHTPAVPFKSVNSHPFTHKICTLGIFCPFRLICFSPKMQQKPSELQPDEIYATIMLPKRSLLCLSQIIASVQMLLSYIT